MTKTHHKKKNHHKKKEKHPKTEDDDVEDDPDFVEDIEIAEDPSDNIEVPPSDPELYPKSYEARSTEQKKEPLSSKLKEKKKELMIGGVVGLILILLIIIIALASKGDSDEFQAGGNADDSAYFAASHSSVGNVDRNDYEANLVAAMKGQPSMFDGLGGDTAHVQALNWLKKDRAAQAYVENLDLDLLLEQYVLTLTVFMSSAHKWFDFFLPKHESWCGNLGLHCDEYGRVTGIGIESLDEMGVKGKIPTEVGFFTELKRLTVRWHGLIGTIPTEVGELNALTSLRVRTASFTGTIPSEIGNLRELQYLSLAHMPFVTGTIPAETFSRLDKLYSLHIQNVKLSGTIPTQIRLPKLNDLWLEDLDLTGGIPRELVQTTGLRALRLSGCGLTGTIPSEIGLLNLVRLDVDHNALTGEVPKLFQTGYRYNCEGKWSSWDCHCDVSHNSFSNIQNAIAVGCRV